jgi:uncharacterized protein (DUF1330 family)
MPAYVFAAIQVQDAQVYEEYKRLVPATVERYGGRYLVRGGRCESVEGGLRPGRVILLEFPTYEDAERWYRSPEYAAVKGLRQSAAETDLLIMEGAG